MSNTNPARGMRDFLPDQIRKRNYVIGVIKEVYEKYGFEPLETPSIENLSTLTNKYGEEGDQLMYKILKRGEKLKKQLRREDEVKEDDLADLALRYDLTVPLARVIANNRNELPRFFKRYQIQPVWRADRPARGRYREFYQCDVDAIGSKSIVVEVELISAVSEILNRLQFSDFEIRVNHRESLRKMVSEAGIGEEQTSDALVSLDKLDKIGAEGVYKELSARGIDQTAASAFLDSVNQESIPKELAELTRMIPQIKIDLSLARGLSYYTGAIFEMVLTKGDFAGSIAGGGRYDGLIGMFGKEEIPAVGLSLGLERILMIMEERDMFPDDLTTNAADVLVTIWNEETASDSLKLAGELRQNGLRVTIYPQPDKLGKQFKYADQIDVPFVCVLGESEIAENTVTLKNMKTGDQETLSVKEAIERLSDHFVTTDSK
ncbi:MAG: histidine--tRNA ligase [Pyrinomonadaceae bacterium]|nr:histidine--tRNA ligase [Pyrinomonadaceae bacterium]